MPKMKTEQYENKKAEIGEIKHIVTPDGREGFGFIGEADQDFPDFATAQREDKAARRII